MIEKIETIQRGFDVTYQSKLQFQSIIVRACQNHFAFQSDFNNIQFDVFFFINNIHIVIVNYETMQKSLDIYLQNDKNKKN